LRAAAPARAGAPVFLVWDQVIVERREGIFVNLLFSRNAPWARLTSFEPYRGEFQLQVQQSRQFYVRMPGWANRDDVHVLVDGEPRITTWKVGISTSVRAGQGST